MVRARSKSEEKRQKILDAATALFMEKGYAATGMAQIAQYADVSKQTVYSHFGNKEELFSAAIERRCDSFEMLDMSMEDLSNPAEILLTLARRFLTMLVSEEVIAVHRVCAYESNTYPHLAELFFKAGPERLSGKVAKLMQAFHDNGILQIEYPKTAAWQFLNMLRGETFLRTEFNTCYQVSAEETERYLVSCVDFFIRGHRCE